MTQHTPEPWYVNGAEFEERHEGALIGRCYITGDIGQTKKTGAANAKRIVQCVNACAGMVDPVHEIKQLRDQVDTLRAALHKAHEILSQRGERK